jgi:hypothetical protein
MHVVLDDDEVSSDEDEPLQNQLRQLFGTGPTVLDEAVVADKEVVDKRAAEKRVMEEAAAKKATEERAVEEAAVKDVTAGVSPAPDQVPSAAGAKRVVAPSGPTPSAKRPYRGVWKPRFVQLSLLSPFFPVGLHSLVTLFAQVLSLRRSHRDGHGCFCRRHRCRRCSCRGNSRAGS